MPEICWSPLCVSLWQGPSLVHWGENKDHLWISSNDRQMLGCQWLWTAADVRPLAPQVQQTPAFILCTDIQHATPNPILPAPLLPLACPYHGATGPTSDTPTWWSEEVHWTEAKFTSVSFGVREEGKTGEVWAGERWSWRWLTASRGGGNPPRVLVGFNAPRLSFDSQQLSTSPAVFFSALQYQLFGAYRHLPDWSM